MFSIAAINDTDSKEQWEPLAPTKEAQEFHLSQTYHEGLLRLEEKAYAKARELFESVLKDPLISNAQVDNSTSDSHLRQLRFLALKNLATVFLRQGAVHNESALQCYLQAVEIDSKDSVVWNQLGTLSCSMGLLSTARWAFEQGLFCSPNNWNCMEKLLEVLIAIGDEVACLLVADLILNRWPSHARALYVKNTIEDPETLPFAPRGIDKLEPKHVRLKFPEKRKTISHDCDNIMSKKRKQNQELNLVKTSWTTLVDAILGVLLPPLGRESETGSDLARWAHTKISFSLPSRSKDVMGSIEGGELVDIPSAENTLPSDCVSGKAGITKERESYTDEGHPHERRSVRLERLRSSKPGKEELEFSDAKDMAKVVFQFLAPFIVNKNGTENYSGAGSSFICHPDGLVYSSESEKEEVMRFVADAANNYGAYHIGHMLLEEVAHKVILCHDIYVKLLQLEKLTRQWGWDRTIFCSLFLAELYYDFGSRSDNESKRMEFFSEASYHLCKVIEQVALDCPDLISTFSHGIDSSKDHACVNDKTGEEEKLLDIRHLSVKLSTVDSVSHVSVIETIKRTFWVRFFWLSGRLSLYSGHKEKAVQDLCMSLVLLRNESNRDDSLSVVPLPHCKSVKCLSINRVQHEINLLKLDSILKEKASKMIEKGLYSECINLLSPIVLSNEDVYLDLLSGSLEDGKEFTPVELRALDILILACEKANPMVHKVYLTCHQRKLQVLLVATGMISPPASGMSPNKNMLEETRPNSEPENVENTKKHWFCMVAEEIKEISRSVSKVKNFVGQNDTSDGASVLTAVIGDIQSLLLTVMSSIVKTIFYQKISGLGSSNLGELLEARCFVDAAIAFCKLQHLDPATSVKTQVELLVAVHDLLAEHGLCCAGKDDEGEEGIFLKLAIKRLLALDMKLKSSSNSSSGGTGKIPSDELHISDHEKTSETGSKSNLTLDSCTVQEEECRALNRETEEVCDKTVCVTEPKRNVPDINLQPIDGECLSSHVAESEHLPIDDEREKMELAIENALDQSFFCLYGLNIKSGLDTSTEEDLAIHRNTSHGDYETKEQCADVFQYILPYAKASSRSNLVKLRRVLRAIRKQFPQPPEHVLIRNFIDNFLDDPDICEDRLSELAGVNGDWESIKNVLFPDGRISEPCKTLTAGRPEPYSEVYGNLYYFIAQAEETSATDKWPGFVLNKEGEEFVEQNTKLFKYDLLYNPSHFESWRRLANIYDEEVDLLLNDGSKHKNFVDWRKDTNLSQRVENGRRRSRRCLLMSLALAKTPVQQSQIHELLALVYYDCLQNVVPIYDQRTVAPVKDSQWLIFCRNSMKHFEKAFQHKSEWLHAFYLGKLCEKQGFPASKAFSYYNKAITLNPSAVDPVYRLHASRLKLLYTCGKRKLGVIKVVTTCCYHQAMKDTISKMFGWTSQDLLCTDGKDDIAEDNDANKVNAEVCQLDEAWRILYNDCISALEQCVEGELKHYHKAKYMIAQGFYQRGEAGDLERAKDELSFCFKSTRSPFTINMWEIDSTAKKSRRRAVGFGKKALEVYLPESSRKFITCIRKYILLYLHLLEKTGDLSTLDRAYIYLRTDKRFSLCLEDIIPVALGRYIQVMISSIRKAEAIGPSGTTSVEHLLEKMFQIYMDQMNIWSDLSKLPEVKSPELTESSLFGYLHLYIQSLESNLQLDMLEGINEKIRKRFKIPKLSNSNSAKVCKHASIAWCRVILIKLALITPLPDSGNAIGQLHNVPEDILQLFVDLHPNELWSSLHENPTHTKVLEMKWDQALSRIKNIRIRQTSEENMEAATALLKSAYNFYKESSSGIFPSGINLYTVPSKLAKEGLCSPGKEGIEVIDLSVPRKILLWSYVLVHGRYSNILAVVKYCEDNAKPRMKKATTPIVTLALPYTSQPISTLHAGNEAEDNPSNTMESASKSEGIVGQNAIKNHPSAKSIFSTPQLHQCSNNNAKGEDVPERPK